MRDYYLFDYENENKFKKLERSLKKYNMVAYRHMYFDCYPKIKEGNFIGKCIESDSTFNTYEINLPTDEKFIQIHGVVKLRYTVNTSTKLIILNTILPERLFLEGHSVELFPFKGTLVSEINHDKDMFKINLINTIKKQYKY